MFEAKNTWNPNSPDYNPEPVKIFIPDNPVSDLDIWQDIFYGKEKTTK